MPQIFRPAMNTVARSTLGGLVLVVVLGFTVSGVVYRSPWVTRESDVVEQPVPFSHEHHVGGLGLDCRYCHTSVTESSTAGFPPTETCMRCHRLIWNDAPMLAPVRESFATGKPIRWRRVHDLPDFVYFDHSIHVAKGIGCVTCHGRVDRMPLTRQVVSLGMQWCLDCHRHPEEYVRPKERVFDLDWKPDEDQEVLGRRLVKEYDIRSRTSCSMCHR